MIKGIIQGIPANTPITVSVPVMGEYIIIVRPYKGSDTLESAYTLDKTLTDFTYQSTVDNTTLEYSFEEV